MHAYNWMHKIKMRIYFVGGVSVDQLIDGPIIQFL